MLNPKEDAFSKTIHDCYDKCESLQAEKCALGEKALMVLERQIKRLDLGLRGLSAREEFPGDWGGPSLLSASGHATGVNTPVPGQGGGGATSVPLQVVSGNIGSVAGVGAPNLAQMRLAAQAAGVSGRVGGGSGAQTPINMPRHQREGSSEANKRRRLNTSLGGSLPAASSNLRQSSLGPGTPKAGTPGPTGTGTSRAGSQQPARPSAGQRKGSSTAVGGRKVAPPQQTTSSNRKRDRTRTTTNKKSSSDRRRQLKSSDRATPSTNASLSEESDSASPTPLTQADGTADRRTRHDASSDDGSGDDDEDNGPYCICQKGSFGEMVCCDNDNCDFQWFHFECVGMKNQPEGEWLCPTCRKLPRDKIVKESQ